MKLTRKDCENVLDRRHKHPAVVIFLETGSALGPVGELVGLLWRTDKQGLNGGIVISIVSTCFWGSDMDPLLTTHIVSRCEHQ